MNCKLDCSFFRENPYVQILTWNLMPKSQQIVAFFLGACSMIRWIKCRKCRNSQRPGRLYSIGNETNTSWVIGPCGSCVLLILE